MNNAINSDQLKTRLREAEDIARSAGQLAMEHFRNLAALNVEKKGKQDYVSRADREVEALIKEALQARFPQDVLLGEESGGETGASMWAIDPIDGTGNFVRGLPLWVVSIGYLYEGRPILGVIYHAPSDTMFSGHIGFGGLPACATQNGAPMRVRENRSTEEACVIVGFSQKRSKKAFIEVLENLLGSGVEFRRLGSAALSLAYVAAGITDGFWQMRLSIWDVAAGIALVQAAGGRTNDFCTPEGLREGNAMLASSPGLTAQLSEATRVPILAP